MILARLELSNFRNYERQEVSFSEGRNLIIGRNAQGKSNLLEAVYFLSHVRSNRAPRLRDLVMEGKDRASVAGAVIEEGGTLNLKVEFGPAGRSASVNGRRMESAVKAAGLLKCVLFSPDDLYVVKGDPNRRRELLDETVEGLGPIQADTIRQYRHVLRQRNALLKRSEEHGRGFDAAMEPWTIALARAGAAITVERMAVLEGMKETLSESYKAIAGEDKELHLEYRGKVDPRGCGLEDAASLLDEALRKSSREERRARTTLIGPHRDDVEITLGGRGARHAASQGEQRTISFCLRVAQKRYLMRRTGKVPVLLLDDVLSELDARRREKVLETAGAESQAIITATELPDGMTNGPGAVFEVSGGEVEVV